jgi:subtilisin-like proprotein convertase family protein
MKLQKILGLLPVMALAAISAPAQFVHTYSAATLLPIPAVGTGGAPGGTSNPNNLTEFTVNVTDAFFVENVDVAINIQHYAVGDLLIQVWHCNTLVSLYSQSPASTADLQGVYNFDSTAATLFAAGVNLAGPNGTVAPGNYVPSNLTTGFNGMNAAGPWSIRIYDLVGGNGGILAGMSLLFHGGNVYTSASPTVNLPDGQNGVCVQPVTQAINVNVGGTVGDILVGIPLTHTYAGDVHIAIQHAGVSAELSVRAGATPANLSGTYQFWDGAATAWTTAESQFGDNQTIPPGAYRPVTPLSVFHGLPIYGVWLITVCDEGLLDTGTVGPAWLRIAENVYSFYVNQPNGPASMTLTNQGGVPGHGFVNLFTLTQGSAPYGWLGGLDIGFADIITQLNFGAPFTGVLGSCGSNSHTILGPIPSGLTVWAASFEIDPTGSPIATKHAFGFVTQ